MVDRFLFSCRIPGFSGYHDLIKSQNWHPTGLWYPSSTCRSSLCDEPLIFILFFKEKNFNLEQKKVTLG